MAANCRRSFIIICARARALGIQPRPRKEQKRNKLSYVVKKDLQVSCACEMPSPKVSTFCVCVCVQCPGKKKKKKVCSARTQKKTLEVVAYRLLRSAGSFASKRALYLHTHTHSLDSEVAGRRLQCSAGECRKEERARGIPYCAVRCVRLLSLARNR